MSARTEQPDRSATFKAPFAIPEIGAEPGDWVKVNPDPERTAIGFYRPFDHASPETIAGVRRAAVAASDPAALRALDALSVVVGSDAGPGVDGPEIVNLAAWRRTHGGGAS